MFKNNLVDTKIAVLEERLSSYEMMMNKIDEAIQLMGRTSQNISKMLAVHEERIEQCHRTDEYVGKVIEDLRVENKNQHEMVSERIQKIEAKLEEFVKFRWILVGVFAMFTFVVSQSGIVIDLLTPNDVPTQVQKYK